MRLWTIHPRYLDARGLVALWREALLARAVLCGKTKGYRHHPQLERFREHALPRYAINAYLMTVYEEAKERGYSFDPKKIGPWRAVRRIPAAKGQVAHEWKHLMKKLARRDPARRRRWRRIRSPQCHPLFRPVSGPVASWERVPVSARSR